MRDKFIFRKFADYEQRSIKNRPRVSGHWAGRRHCLIHFTLLLMKSRILLLALIFISLGSASFAQTFVNLTPRPKSMTTAEGSLELTQGFKVSTASLPDSMAGEVDAFVKNLNAATGLNATADAAGGDALLRVVQDNSLAPEAYTLKVDAGGATLKASTATGLYWGLQTIKKVLPANVMAGTKAKGDAKYALPFVTVNDSPRFGYRGFMLDVSRHFFTVEEVKRVLDVMSFYKMNRFHWHLTDDQGWRVEIKKYPRLTTVGATASNSYVVDLHDGDYWLNKQYGPYFYTQDELREVVAYAKKLHIEIIPEIDMPGHFSAAMAAYPEFSCWPEGSHGVVTNIGGVYADVLNVADPKAVQFAKDVLSELMDIFPSKTIHIGGDECPTSAWEGNALCQEKYKKEGLTSYRQLQSHFIREMDEFVKSKGRELAVWNEAITAGSADTEILKNTGATVYCWVGADNAAAKATQLRMPHIYTPQIPFYINRKESNAPETPAAAGPGTDTKLDQVYAKNIPVGNAALMRGIQGTFWCEYVAFPDYLEFLMLPRLIAIAEKAWTPANLCNYSDFTRRITADTALLNAAGYTYSKFFLDNSLPAEKVMPKASTEKHTYYYMIRTNAQDSRKGRVWELLRNGSPLIAQYSSNGAAAGRLWSAPVSGSGDASYDYQLWSFEADPAGSGKFAIVNKTAPKGSLSATPTADNVDGRFLYDTTKKHYNFTLGTGGYGKSGNAYYYTVLSDRTSGSSFINCAAAGRGLAINVWSDPTENGGQGMWTLMPMFRDLSMVKDSLNSVLDTLRSMLPSVKIYSVEDGKQIGRFGSDETETLSKLVNFAAVEDLDETGIREYSSSLKRAMSAFYASMGRIETGKTFVIKNSTEAFAGTMLADEGKTNLVHTIGVWDKNVAWTVTSTKDEGLKQTVKLKNIATGKFISSVSAKNDRLGYPVIMGTSGTDVVIEFTPKGDYTISIGGKNLFPVSDESVTLPGTVSCGAGSPSLAGNAGRRQGAAWSLGEGDVFTYLLNDESGKEIGRQSRFVAKGEKAEETTPELKNYNVVKATVEGNTVTVTYKRVSNTVTVEATDRRGAVISREETAVPVGETFTYHTPEPKYYTLENTAVVDGTAFVPESDTTVTAVFMTEAFAGVRAIDKEITGKEALKNGMSILIYDNSDANDGARKGYRTVISNGSVNRITTLDDATPRSVWTLTKSGTGYKIYNEYKEKYVPVFGRDENPVLSAAGGVFSFSTNADGSWRIAGSNGQCWDGQANGNLVGWNSPGHPHKLFTYFVEPFFEVTMLFVDKEGNSIAPSEKQLVRAGTAYTLAVPTIDNYAFEKFEGAETVEAVEANTEVRAIYSDTSTGIEAISDGEKDVADGIYDLTGRSHTKISRPGIYVVGGKKVMVK